MKKLSIKVGDKLRGEGGVAFVVDSISRKQGRAPKVTLVSACARVSIDMSLAKAEKLERMR